MTLDSKPYTIKFVGKEATFLCQLPPGWDGRTKIVGLGNYLYAIHPDFAPLKIDRKDGTISDIFGNKPIPISN